MPPMEGKTQLQEITTDTVLALAKKGLTEEQVIRINTLENTISRGDVKNQQLSVYHQLAHFWNDSARLFEPYAWYEAEAARLENSEKNLTFAARLFLDNMQAERDPALRRWKALQAKDLFERSLIINPANDSARIGIGACFLFGEISASPMEGIQKVMEVVKRDSNNVYAQVTLARGAVLSGQYDKALARLESINSRRPGDVEVVLLLAEVNERMGQNEKAIEWYKTSLPLLKNEVLTKEVEKRIKELTTNG
ncbi:MAG: tetratricopeptide repeat protein [Chitinophagaceae bacterium]|nr:tetratricopeptide repeat protein [Chitinophagaceae bacterium]